MPQRLRIFVSSPSDVPDERLRAALIVDKLSQDYSRFFFIETYRWEHEAMLASAHFQDAIEPPSAFDIVVLILWSRLGTPLPEKTAEREYRGIDGRAPVTGTEWEYEEALKVAQEKKAPDLLAFRNLSPAPFDTGDPEARARSNAQLDALDQFWRRHFADRGVFLAAYDEYRTLEEFAQRLEESLRKLIERRIRDVSAGELRTEPIWLGEPFRGLEAYEFEHAPIFFGRDAAVTKAIEQLAANAHSGHAFLLVSGASGSGKSSLVKAGVVPRLMKPQRISGAAFLRRAVFRPGAEGADVFLGLAKALTQAVGQDVGLPELIAPGQDAGQLATHLRGAVGDPGYLFVNALGRLTEAGRKSGRLLAFEDAKLILVVDQLEELFTVPGIGPADRRLIVQVLAGLARSGAVWVIATVRVDFWHRAAEIPELITLTEGQGRIDLAAASPAELAEMIRKPAQLAGLFFEVHPETRLGLDAVLAEDAAAAPGALPLLSFTLDELYKNAKARGATVLTFASYEALGGLEGAIAKRADEIVGRLPAAAQAALPRVLRAVTTVSGVSDQTPVARSVPLESFPEGSPARTLIDAFIAARLLVAASEGGSAATVRLAHEALISRWQRARDQLAADHRDLQTRAIVERQFERWTKKPRRSLLLRNPDLASAVDLARRWGEELDPSLQDFVRRSARRARLTQTLTAAAAVLFALIAASAGGLYLVAQKQRADALIAQSKFLARDARTATANGNPTLGALLALAAMPPNLAAPDRPFIKEAGSALEDALDNQRERAVIAVHWLLKAAAMSPDGSKIATGTADKFARIWDSRTGKQLLALAHNDTVQLVVFSSDSKRLITAEDGWWHIWDADTGREIFKFIHQAQDFPVFLLGRQRVITAVKGSAIELRNVNTGELIATLGTLGYSDSSAVVFSRDGTKILISSGRSKPQLWDALGGTLLWELATEGSSIGRCCAFSPDGSRLILIVNKNVEVLDVATGETVVTLGPRPDRPGLAILHAAALSVDNKRAITIIEDTVYLWDATTGAAIVPLKHDGDVSSANFSPDGSRLLTVSPGQVRLWDTAQGQEIISLRAHPADNEQAEGRFAAGSVAGLLLKSAPVVPIDVRPIPLAVVSPRGDRVLISFDAASTQVLDSATGGQIARLDGTLRPSSGAAFTPDGRLVVTAATNGASNVWDVKTGKLVATLRDQEGEGGSAGIASFSSDGRSLMTYLYYAVQVWNLDPLVVALQDPANDLRSYRGRVNSVAFSPDGTKLATAAADKTGRVWDVRTGAALLTLRGHDAEVMSVAFAPDGEHLLTASLDKTARLWDAATGAALTVFESHDDGVNAASFSPDGKFIVTASTDKTAKVWDATNGNVLLTFRGHDNTVMSAVFSPDGKSVLSASETLLIWDARTGAVLKKLLPLREAAGQSSGWSGDTDPKDATAWNNWIKRWESVTHAAQINTKGWHRSFAFYSPDGTQVVGATSEWLAEVWNVGTGLPIHILQNDAATWDAQFSPDARYVVSASADGAALLWAVKASEPNSPLITKLAGHESAVKAIAFSPSGAQLATAAANGTVRIWNIAHCQTAIDRAHEMLPREMSDHESYEYFLSKKTASTATDIFAKVRPWLAFALPAAGDACEW